MISLKETLARISATDLTVLLGEDTLSHLELLDEKKYLKSSLLAELVIKRYGDVDILLDKALRERLITALRSEQAKTLCEEMSFSKKGDHWKLLIEKFRKPKREDLEVLFKGFGLEYHPREPEPRIPILEVKPVYPLFDHQIIAAGKVSDVLEHKEIPRVLLHMPTGSGKTRTAMNVISTILRTTKKEKSVILWLAHTLELCDQALEEFQGAWESLGNRPLNIYKYFGNAKADFSKVTDGILISSLGLLYQHSLSKQSQFFEMAKKVDMVIMDEAHQAIAPTYEHLLRILMPTGKTKFLGLSATPGRGYLSAEQDIELAQFFNRQKVELEVEGYDNPIEFLTENGYLAEVDYEKLDYSGGELSEKELEYLNNFYDISPQTLVKISKDKARNLILVKRISEEAKEGKKIIVFACSVEHAYLLQNLLQLNGFKTACKRRSNSVTVGGPKV